MYEMNLETLPDLEDEWELPLVEGELEGEAEADRFFGALTSLARSAAQSPTLRRVGLTAARAALRGLRDVGGTAGAALSPQAAALGRQLGGTAGLYLSRRLPQQEYELEGVSPLRRIYPNALLEHLGHAASTAASEAEAEAFIGAMFPLAAQLFPRAAPTLLQAAPGLIRGLSGVARTLRQRRRTYPLLRTLPSVVRATAAQIGRQAARQGPVSPQVAVRALAHQTNRTLGSAQQAVQAYRRARALDHRYHEVHSGRR